MWNLLLIKKSNKKRKKVEAEFNYGGLKLPMGMLEINKEIRKRKNEFIELYNALKTDKDNLKEQNLIFMGIILIQYMFVTF